MSLVTQPSGGNATNQNTFYCDTIKLVKDKFLLLPETYI